MFQSQLLIICTLKVKEKVQLWLWTVGLGRKVDTSIPDCVSKHSQARG